MKKTIKTFIVTFMIAVLSIFSLCFTACQENYDKIISVNLDYKIYDYDRYTMTRSDTPITENKIVEGQYYCLVLDINCDDLEASIQNEEVDVKVTVEMGDYENDINRKKLLESSVFSDVGLSFSEKDSEYGVFETTFILSKDGFPDFTKVGFMFCCLGNKNFPGYLNVEPITVDLELIDKNSEYRIIISDTGTSKSILSLIILEQKNA